jgi:anti-sigma B factor antagonist
VNTPDGALRIERLEHDHAGIIALAVIGDLDMATVPTLTSGVRPLLVTAAGRHIVLELSGVGFCDSTGLGALVGLHNAATDAAVHLVLASPRSQVTDVLALSGVDQLIAAYPTLDAAATALSSTD